MKCDGCGKDVNGSDTIIVKIDKNKPYQKLCGVCLMNTKPWRQKHICVTPADT